MTHNLPPLRLRNLGGSVPSGQALEDFFQEAAGVHVLGMGDASGEPYLRLRLGDVDVNAFTTPIFAEPGETIGHGWSHVSLETTSLDAYLRVDVWHEHLVWGPELIETQHDSRRIAFFEPTPGLRIELMEITVELPDLATVPGASTIYEAASRRGGTVGLVHRAGPAGLIGPALTVTCQPGDNLAVHRAAALASRGDVVVVAGQGLPIGYVGDVLVDALLNRGVAGLVVDGGVRDIETLREQGLPVWSTSVSMIGASKSSPGEIGNQITVAGASVRTGDLVRADLDGVVFVRRLEWPDVLERALAREQKESELKRAISEGESTMSLFALGSADNSADWRD